MVEFGTKWPICVEFGKIPTTNFGPSFINPQPSLIEFGRCRAKSGRIRPTLDEVGPQLGASPGKTWSNFADSGPMLTDHAPSFVGISQRRPKFPRNRPEFGSRARFGRVRAKVAVVWIGVATHLGAFGRSSIECDRFRHKFGQIRSGSNPLWAILIGFGTLWANFGPRFKNVRDRGTSPTEPDPDCLPKLVNIWPHPVRIGPSWSTLAGCCVQTAPKFLWGVVVRVLFECFRSDCAEAVAAECDVRCTFG